MSIQSEVIGKEYHLSVIGNLDSKEEREAVIALLQGSQSDNFGGKSITEIHVTFFDAEMLATEILEALKSHREAVPGVALKVFVFHKHLSSYLNRLGIPNQLVFAKTLTASLPQPIKALAIGGSAESLDKIFTLLANLPLANLSVFIVQHFPQDARNILDSLLKDRTPYAAKIAEEGMTVAEQVIYIAPSNAHMVVRNGVIHLTQDAPVNYARPSIDVLFESAAQEYKGALLAVLLCGYGSDGSASLAAVKANHARIIIEDPLDCAAREMPNSALRTGYYDYKFPLPELVSYITRNIKQEEIDLHDRDLKPFLSELHARYGYDYRDYSMDSIKRRLQKFMSDQGFTTFTSLSAQVLADAELFEELFLTFSINVTHFFRDPAVFRTIREQVLPYLDTYAHIKIWCAGCSTGEEPYSLAMLLDEYGILKKAQIYATDINPFVIAEAKNGLFQLEALETSIQNYQQSGGMRTFQSYFARQADLLKIQSHLRDRILFFQHSLVKSGVLNEFQLILCRNVLIYFNQTLQRNVLKLFGQSLTRNGFLILGESESLTAHESRMLEFTEYDKKHKIYRKRKVAG